MDYNLVTSRARGTVFIELFVDRPITRDNFLAYVNGGKYDGTLMHRLARNFVLQGGGFEAEDHMYVDLPAPLYVALAPDRVDLDGNPNTANPMIANERLNTPFRSNTTGTLAMAKQGGNPNSATSEFFFNLNNNGGANPDPAGPCTDQGLDCQNGGFTVFARVVGDGMNLINLYNAQLAAADLNFDTNGNNTHDSTFHPVTNPNPDQGAFGTVPVLGSSYLDFDPLTLYNADRIDYLGNGLLTTVPSGGLTFSTRDTFIDTGATFTGTGELRVGAGRKLGVREGTLLATRSLRNFGTLEPGLNIGGINLQSYNQEAGAHLAMEINGPSFRPTTNPTLEQYDRLIVSGGVLLGGDLDVILNRYSPVAGDSFTLLTAAAILGQFSDINLPGLTAGLVWNYSQTSTAITLSVVAADFNGDGVVDAADYVYWRKINGPGANYTTWRQNFGNTAGGDGGAGGFVLSGVPEPSSAVLIGTLMPFLLRQRGRRSFGLRKTS